MCWNLASFQGRLIVWTMRRNVRKRELFRLFHRLRLRLSNGPTTYIHYTYLQDKIYNMNILTVVRVTPVSTSIYLQTMPHTERSRVVWLAESPAQETVGQARLAGPLPSQHHNLPPEHAVQPRLPPLLPFLPEQQLNQVLTPLPTHLELRRSCLVESVGTVQSVSPGLLGRARGGGSHRGESEQE